MEDGSKSHFVGIILLISTLIQYVACSVECPEPHRHMLQDYKAFHDANKYSPDAQYIVQQCWGVGCQGAGDRLRGALFQLRVAMHYKKIYILDWTNPCAITNFLVPNQIDWRATGFPEDFIHSANTMTVPEFNATTLYSNESEEAIEKFKSTKIFSMTGVRQFEAMAPRLTPVDRENGLALGACYFQYLFKLNETIVRLGDEKLSQLYGPKPADYVAWHWRHLDVDRLVETPVVANGLLRVMDCAGQLANSVGVDLRSRPVLLVTDFNIFRQLVARGKFRNVVTTNTTAKHIDKGRHSLVEYSEVFVDLYLLSRARCLLTSWSGYSKLALWMGSSDLLKCHRDMGNCNMTTVQLIA